MFTIVPILDNGSNEQINIWGGDLLNKFSIHEAEYGYFATAAYKKSDILKKFLVSLENKRLLTDRDDNRYPKYCCWTIQNNQVIYLINEVLKEFDSDKVWENATADRFTIKGSDCGTYINLINKKLNIDRKIYQTDKVISAINRVLRP